MSDDGSPSSPSLDDVLFDRQVRLWGGHGQRLIRSSHLLVLGSSATMVEMLKSLLVTGIQRYTIVDDVITSPTDLMNNIFLTEAHVNQPRCKAVGETLSELNDRCEYHAIHEPIGDYIIRLLGHPCHHLSPSTPSSSSPPCLYASSHQQQQQHQGQHQWQHQWQHTGHQQKEEEEEQQQQQQQQKEPLPLPLPPPPPSPLTTYTTILVDIIHIPIILVASLSSQCYRLGIPLVVVSSLSLYSMVKMITPPRIVFQTHPATSIHDLFLHPTQLRRFHGFLASALSPRYDDALGWQGNGGDVRNDNGDDVDHHVHPLQLQSSSPSPSSPSPSLTQPQPSTLLPSPSSPMQIEHHHHPLKHHIPFPILLVRYAIEYLYLKYGNDSEDDNDDDNTTSIHLNPIQHHHEQHPHHHHHHMIPLSTIPLSHCITLLHRLTFKDVAPLKQYIQCRSSSSPCDSFAFVSISTHTSTSTHASSSSPTSTHASTPTPRTLTPNAMILDNHREAIRHVFHLTSPVVVSPYLINALNMTCFNHFSPIIMTIHHTLQEWYGWDGGGGGGGAVSSSSSSSPSPSSSCDGNGNNNDNGNNNGNGNGNDNDSDNDNPWLTDITSIYPSSPRPSSPPTTKTMHEESHHHPTHMEHDLIKLTLLMVMLQHQHLSDHTPTITTTMATTATMTTTSTASTTSTTMISANDTGKNTLPLPPPASTSPPPSSSPPPTPYHFHIPSLILLYSLRLFFLDPHQGCGTLPSPQPSTLPDMASSTQEYLHLGKLYAEQFHHDVRLVLRNVDYIVRMVKDICGSILQCIEKHANGHHHVMVEKDPCQPIIIPWHGVSAVANDVGDSPTTTPAPTNANTKTHANTNTTNTTNTNTALHLTLPLNGIHYLFHSLSVESVIEQIAHQLGITSSSPSLPPSPSPPPTPHDSSLHVTTCSNESTTSSNESTTTTTTTSSNSSSSTTHKHSITPNNDDCTHDDDPRPIPHHIHDVIIHIVGHCREVRINHCPAVFPLYGGIVHGGGCADGGCGVDKQESSGDGDNTVTTLPIIPHYHGVLDAIPTICSVVVMDQHQYSDTSTMCGWSHHPLDVSSSLLSSSTRRQHHHHYNHHHHHYYAHHMLTAHLSPFPSLYLSYLFQHGFPFHHHHHHGHRSHLHHCHHHHHQQQQQQQQLQRQEHHQHLQHHRNTLSLNGDHLLTSLSSYYTTQQQHTRMSLVSIIHNSIDYGDEDDDNDGSGNHGHQNTHQNTMIKTVPSFSLIPSMYLSLFSLLLFVQQYGYFPHPNTTTTNNNNSTPLSSSSSPSSSLSPSTPLSLSLSQKWHALLYPHHHCKENNNNDGDDGDDDDGGDNDGNDMKRIHPIHHRKEDPALHILYDIHKSLFNIVFPPPPSPPPPSSSSPSTSTSTSSTSPSLSSPQYNTLSTSLKTQQALHIHHYTEPNITASITASIASDLVLKLIIHQYTIPESSIGYDGVHAHGGTVFI